MNFIEFNLREKATIPKEEDGFWDECKLFENTIIVSKAYSTLKEMNECWRSTVHFVAGYIQDKVNEYGFSDETASDIYTIFLCKEHVPIEVSMEIERDKFCCKKYVFNIQQEQDVWGLIESKMPLLCKWTQDDSDVTVSSRGSSKSVREKLTEGNNTALGSILCCEDNFIELPATEILKRLMDWEDRSVGGVDAHE